MTSIALQRAAPTPDGVFGLFLLSGVPTLHSMEDDWRNNQPRVSCIPAGTYRLRRTIYHRHGYETFEVTGVPNRTRILIHPANTEEDVEGCIGLGLRQGKLTVADEDAPGYDPITRTGPVVVEKRAVVASQEAFHVFMRAMQHVDEAELVILWKDGQP